MNERIKELAHRCGFTEYGGDDGADGADDESLTKFATLIITECCGATECQPRSEIRNSILNHFGMTVPELNYGSGVNYRPTLPTEE